MWPGFQDGDLLACRPTAFNRVRIGDCVLYRQFDQRLVVHRVVGRCEGLLVTKGDYLANTDRAPIAPQQLLGIIVSRRRLGQERIVRGSWRGVLWGRWSRLAGRLDPDRPARSGRLARGLRKLCRPLSVFLCRRGAYCDRNGRLIWKIGNIPLAGKTTDGTWQVPWPQKLFLDPGLIRQHLAAAQRLLPVVH